MKHQSKIIIKTLEKANKIAIFGHVNPDGDSIGSVLGLAKLLKKQGKKVSCFMPNETSILYDFLPEVKTIKTKFDYAKYDVLVFLDCSDIYRIDSIYTNNEKYFEQQQKIFIDHHCGGENDPLSLKDPTAMSTCEIIFEITYPLWEKYYDKDIATYLYLGLTTDSGNFRYDEDHIRILSNALALVKLGAEKKLVVDNTFRKKSYQGVKFMQLLFKRIKKIGDLYYSYYTDKELHTYGIDKEEADFGQIIIKDIQEAKVTMIIRKIDKQLRASLRSKEYNVEGIAKLFGGGGHKYAAGFKVESKGKLQEQIQSIAKKIMQNIPKKKQ